MFSSRWGALFSVDDFGERDTNSWRVAVQTHHALVLQIPCEVRSLGTSLTHSKTTCRRERREHKGCIYIYMLYVYLLGSDFGMSKFIQYIAFTFVSDSKSYQILGLQNSKNKTVAI